MIYTSEVVDTVAGTTTITTWDTTAGTMTISVDGGITERPMTSEELTYWRQFDVTAEAEANVTEMTAESDAAVDKLVLVIEALNAITDRTNATINSNPAATIKDIAREVKTIARQVNREARMTSGRTEDTYTGPEET